MPRRVVGWSRIWALGLALAGCGDPATSGRDPSGQPSDDGGTGDAMSPDVTTATDCADVTCHAQASCDDSGGAPVCSCGDGYEGDGTSACDDVDECADGTDDCHADATCTNTDGSFGCLCDTGYDGNGTSACDDVNECQSNRNTCDPNASCSNSTGGFGCECAAGTSGDGLGCGDVDECADSGLFTCAANAGCRNTFGAYACDCDVLYAGDGKTQCDPLCDIALADPDVCDPNGICRITNVKGAVCDACAPGYVQDTTDMGAPGDTTIRTCVAAGDCPAHCDGLSGDDSDNVICGGPPAGRLCFCAPGYFGDPAPGFNSCADVDECAAGTHGCGNRADCRDADGGFTCECKEGWTKDASGACVNLNECALDPGPCHPNAVCADDSPGFTCTCRDGYEGDGAVCRDVDECTEGTDDCPSGARCINTAGSFECTDIDECAQGLDACDANATCTNDDPGYTCDCGDDFMGDGRSCTCDLSGYWAMRQDVTVTWPVQMVSTTTTIACGCMKSTVWELHKYTYDGKIVGVEKKGCGQEDAPDLVAPIFGGETYSSFIPYSVYDPIPPQAGIDIPFPDAVPGSSFVTPTEAAVVGIKLDDPLNDPWPLSRANVNPPGGGTPEWDDLEGDDQPGLTLWPRPTCDEVLGVTEDPDACVTNSSQGVNYDYLPVEFMVVGPDLVITQRAGCLSGATRVKTHMEADVESCTKLTGTVVNDDTKTRFHSCLLVDAGGGMSDWRTLDVTCNASDWADVGAMPCTDAHVNFLDAQSPSAVSDASFELVKIAGLSDAEPTCGEVRTELPGFGARTCSNACNDN